jgi:hypothetical protein
MNRDLNDDLRICAEATVGPWTVGSGYEQSDRGNYVASDKTGVVVCAEQDGTDCVLRDGDARFISEARTGWEHAIERALTAEARLSAFQSSNVINFKRACLAEAEVARLRTLFRELMGHVSEPFLAYNDAEHAVKFYANHVRETVEYVHNTAKEALYDGRQP